ncbi:MAG: hypothetical protein DMD54_06545 [Gemmatimonadetes bacterium]|nr:MAG: hypothetical protein DMD54_06545 [Gemmatimonadota bacterium]
MSGLTLALLLGGVTTGRAQGCLGNPCSVTNTASVTVGTVLSLTLSSTATALTAPSQTSYDNGFQDDPAALTATVKANRGWTLSVKSSAASWTPSGAGARVAKPAADLQWSTSGGAPFTALTTSNAGLGTSASGTASVVQTISYRTLWDYTLDTPGTYSLDVVFTVTAP